MRRFTLLAALATILAAQAPAVQIIVGHAIYTFIDPGNIHIIVVGGDALDGTSAPMDLLDVMINGFIDAGTVGTTPVMAATGWAGIPPVFTATVAGGVINGKRYPDLVNLTNYVISNAVVMDQNTTAGPNMSIPLTVEAIPISSPPTAAPEPSTAALAGIVLLAAAFTVRRRLT